MSSWTRRPGSTVLRRRPWPAGPGEVLGRLAESGSAALVEGGLAGPVDGAGRIGDADGPGEVAGQVPRGDGHPARPLLQGHRPAHAAGRAGWLELGEGSRGTGRGRTTAPPRGRSGGPASTAGSMSSTTAAVSSRAGQDIGQQAVAEHARRLQQRRVSGAKASTAGHRAGDRRGGRPGRPGSASRANSRTKSGWPPVRRCIPAASEWAPPARRCAPPAPPPPPRSGPRSQVHRVRGHGRGRAPATRPGSSWR